MDRYPSRANGSRMGQADRDKHLLTAHGFQTSGSKLYAFTNNLNDTSSLPPVDERNLNNTSLLPPVGEKRRRGVLVNQYGDGDILGACTEFERQSLEAWDEIPTYTLENTSVVTRTRPNWKEERKMRVENAMRRVEQSYVGEIRYENQDATYVRSEAPKLPEKRRPHDLVPLERRPLPNVDVGDLKFLPDVYNADHIDKSVLIPSSKDGTMNRSLEEEMELDMKRQILLEKKIKEANEFHRKQKLNAFKPAKESKGRPKETKKSITNDTDFPAPSHDLYKPVPPIRGDSKEKLCPVPPPMAKQEDSYSKRKRRLKPCATQMSDERANGSQNTVRRLDVAPPKQSESGSSYCFSHAVPGTTREGKHGMSFGVDTRGFEKPPVFDESPNVSDKSHKPPLIPRQASFNIWNGETAKRGLGFKSKLRKEMEEASLRNVKPDEDFLTTKQNRTRVSSNVAAKWKRKMFHDN